MTQQLSGELFILALFVSVNERLKDVGLFLFGNRNNAKFKILSRPLPLVERHAMDAKRASGSAMKEVMFLPQLT